MFWFFIHGFRSVAELLEVTSLRSLSIMKLEGFGAPLALQEDEETSTRGCFVHFGKRLSVAQVARELPRDWTVSQRTEAKKGDSSALLKGGQSNHEEGSQNEIPSLLRKRRSEKKEDCDELEKKVNGVYR